MWAQFRTGFSTHQTRKTRDPYPHKPVPVGAGTVFHGYGCGSTKITHGLPVLFTIDRVTIPEVPVPMVALVATAVSPCSQMCASLLTRVASCMPRSMSGVLASNCSLNFQQTRIWMSIKATSTHWVLFRRNVAMHFAPWWRTSIHAQGEFYKPSLVSWLTNRPW